MNYSLQLADGQCWRFQAEAPLRAWMRRFASVLSMSENDDSPTLSITFRDRHGTAPSSPPLYDLGILALRSGGNPSEWFCDIDRAYDGDFVIDRMLYALYAVYRETVRRMGLPFHAGLIEKDGRGILLAGSSGAGKSTACRRLDGVFRVLCDEESLIVRDGDGFYWAHPFPTWSRLSGTRPLSAWPAETALPLAHILFLQPDREDGLVSLGEAQTAMHITKIALEKCRWSLLNRDDGLTTRRQVFDNACRMALSVPGSVCRMTLHGPLQRIIASLDESL